MKTNEEMHEMSKDELGTYKSEIWRHWQNIDTILTYRIRIGEPKLLPPPPPIVDVEFEQIDEEE